MNRFVKKQLKEIRDSCNAIEAYLNARDEPEEEPTEEELESEELPLDEDHDMTNWTTADEPEKEGIYLKDLRELTDLKGITIIGQIKTVFDLKSYVKKEGGAGLIYRVVLNDPTGDVTIIAFDDMATKLKQYTIGQYLKITNAWKMQENKQKVLELHVGNFAKIEVVEWTKYKYKTKPCKRCSKEYTPTGGCQKVCVDCRIPNKREKSLSYYHTHRGSEYSKLYKRARSDTFVDIEAIITLEEFREKIREVMNKRRGSILSTKTTMRRVLKDIGVYADAWLQKRNRGGMALSFYEMIYDEFEAAGGVYFGTTNNAGDQFQFPLKERKT